MGRIRIELVTRVAWERDPLLPVALFIQVRSMLAGKYPLAVLIIEGLILMALLTRDQILAVKLKTKQVYVPALEAEVILRELTGAQRDAYEAGIVGSKTGKDAELNLQNARARLVVMCLVDEKGARLFKDNEATLLGQLGAAALDFMYDECRSLSGISEKDKAALEKNLSSDTPIASGTD